MVASKSKKITEKVPKAKKAASKAKPRHVIKAKAKARGGKLPAKKADAWKVLKSPYLTEKSTRMIELQNKLVFLVRDRSTKSQIKNAVESAFSVKVLSVNTSSTMRGERKAYVRLAPEFKAVDIATKLGMM